MQVVSCYTRGQLKKVKPRCFGENVSPIIRATANLRVSTT